MKNIFKILLALLLGVQFLFAATVTTTKDSYNPQESIVAQVSGLPKTKKCNPDKANNDCAWVGLFYAYDDSKAENLLNYQYASQKGDESFTFSGLSDPSEYEVRVFFKNSFNEEATHNFKVLESQHAIDVKTVKNTYQTGEAITVHVKNLPGNNNDFIALFHAYDESVAGNVIQKIETDGEKEGDFTFNSLNVAAEYEVRAFTNGTFDEKDYYPFTVTQAPLPVTVCNILQNASFESDTQGWTVYGSTALVNDAHDGSKALRIFNGGLDQMSQKLTNGVDTYQFNGYYKTDGKTDGIWLGMGFYDNNKNLIFERSSFLKDSNSYKKFVLNATATPETKYIEVWLWSDASNNQGKIILDNLRLSTAACYNYALPSSLPPKGLAPNQVPQFVVLGFDDNTKSEGIDWAINLFANKFNHDGSAAKTSFYLNTRGLHEEVDDDPQALLQAMKRLAASGNEMGNHTDNHHQQLEGESEDAFFSRIKKLNKAQWQPRIDNASDDLINLVGLKQSDIKGFRAPYLLFNQYSMQILKEENFLYDCSIEDGYAPDFNGKNFRWPYQLNEGSPGHNESWYGNQGNSEYVDIKMIPGLWELPMYPVMIPKDSECAAYDIPTGLWDRLQAKLPYIDDYRMTGLDYNIWSLGGATKREMLGILKYNLDLRLAGNRAPFMFGTHSQYYTKEWADDNAPNANVDDMRAALREFVDYALSKDAVRIRPSKDIIQWCKNPQPL